MDANRQRATGQPGLDSSQPAWDPLMLTPAHVLTVAACNSRWAKLSVLCALSHVSSTSTLHNQSVLVPAIQIRKLRHRQMKSLARLPS